MRTVLVFSWFYLPYVGGSELFLEAVTRRLADRFRFHIVTARGRRALPRREERDGVVVWRVGTGSAADKLLYPAPAVARALALERVDLVHAVMVNAAALAARLYLAARPRPSLLTLQSGDSEEYVRRYLGPLFPLYPRLHRAFDRVHAISGFLRDRAVAYGAPADRIAVVPNGVDVGLFSRAAVDEKAVAELRERLGLVGRRVVVSVSRLALKNAIADLVRALGPIARDHPDVALLLVGDGEDRERLERLARELGVRDRIVFAGTVPHEETPRYLALAEVFVRPSVSEGLGTAFLEAMACELPVVASPVGGIAEFVTEGETGLLVEPSRPESIARAVSRLLADADLRRRLGAKGRRLVEERYRWDAVAERIGELYEELVSSRP